MCCFQRGVTCVKQFNFQKRGQQLRQKRAWFLFGEIKAVFSHGGRPGGVKCSVVIRLGADGRWEWSLYLWCHYSSSQTCPQLFCLPSTGWMLAEQMELLVWPRGCEYTGVALSQLWVQCPDRESCSSVLSAGCGCKKAQVPVLA